MPCEISKDEMMFILMNLGNEKFIKIKESLILQELIKEEIKILDKRCKSQPKASGTPNKLREIANYLQDILERSKIAM